MTMPLALDLAQLPTALVGNGALLLKRLRMLDTQPVRGLVVYAPEPEPVLVTACGTRLTKRLPNENEIASLRVLFVAGLSRETSGELAAVARRHRVLVNVEDDIPLCDFHVPAIVRRGDLALSISTGGASPTLSRRLRQYLEQLFPEDWSQKIARLATLRQSLRQAGASPADVIAATEALIEAEAWLPPST